MLGSQKGSFENVLGQEHASKVQSNKFCRFGWLRFQDSNSTIIITINNNNK